MDLTSIGRVELEELVKTLTETAKQVSAVYKERNTCVIAMAKMARMLGWDAGIGRDREAEDGFQYLVFIDTPHGQVSWHIPDDELERTQGLPVYERHWDGHTTELKYARLKRL